MKILDREKSKVEPRNFGGTTPKNTDCGCPLDASDYHFELYYKVKRSGLPIHWQARQVCTNCVNQFEPEFSEEVNQ